MIQETTLIRVKLWADKGEVEEEIELEVSKIEYEKMKEALLSGESTFIDLGDRIIRSGLIKYIRESVPRIDKKFRLEPPKVSGMSQANRDERMKDMFDTLKKNGLFKGYQTYDKWQASLK